MSENEYRLAIVAIIVSNGEAAEKVNAALHDYATYVVGRMGLPLRERAVNAITVVLDAPQNVVNALTGRLGKIDGVSAKALFR